MKIPHHTPLALVLAGVIATATAGTAHAANTQLTVYRSDNASLYASSGNGSVDDGHAVVHEQRSLSLKAGVHDVSIGNLPIHLDPEALALSFPDGNASVVSQRLMLAQGASGPLTGLVGHKVHVLGSSGESLANGTLLRAGDGLLVQTILGPTLVRHYAAVRSSDGQFPLGSTLNLQVDAKRAGTANAVLSYPTAGLGWRAAYVATLQPGKTCRMQFESRASIANRSGRDWKDTQLILIAGEPNMAKPSAPRPMLAMANAYNAKRASADLPQQEALDDYRSYRLAHAVDLPAGSISQVPLYASRTMDCERTALFENGNAYQPPRPMLNRDFNPGGNSAVTSTLKLHAFDSLPAGYLRVLTADSHGALQFIGEGRIDDTAKGGDATITLGTAFDLHGERQRTQFSVDKAGHTLDEAFRITLTNAGDSPRTVTVREHPNRWRQWSVTSSSIKPSSKTTDTLELRVQVPANGKATLDYALRYHWSADDNPSS